MTTPDVNIDIDLGLMPYGVPMSFTAENRNGQIPEGYRNDRLTTGHVRIPLDSGVYMIQANYDGEESAEVTTNNFAGTKKRVITTVPAKSGGGWRSAPPVQISCVDDQTFVYLATSPTPAEDATGGITIIPMGKQT